MKLSWAMVFDLLIMVIFIWALWESRHFNVRAGLFPWAIGFPVLALSMIQLGLDFLMVRGGEGRPSVASRGLTGDGVNRRTFAIFCWILGFFVAIWLLGFSIGIPLLTFLQLKFGGREKWGISIILALCTWAFIYGVFITAIKVPLPAGKLFLWLL